MEALAQEMPCEEDVAPITGLFGPPLLRSAATNKAGVHYWSCLALASHASLGARENFRYVLDGATHQLTLGAGYQLENGWRLGAEVPIVQIGGGHLDGLIESWHDVFGLPNGVRDQLPEDSLDFRVSSNGKRLATLNTTTTRIGDLTVSLAKEMYSDSKKFWQLGVYARLPAGSERDFSGTGSAAVGIATAGSRDMGATGRWSLSWQVSMQWQNAANWQALPVRRWQGAGSLRTRFQVRPGWFLHGGLRSTTEVVNMDLRPFSQPMLALDIGTSFDTSRARWFVGFSEDLRVSSQPDVVFRAGVSLR